jgi:hypothetical protein
VHVRFGRRLIPKDDYGIELLKARSTVYPPSPNITIKMNPPDIAIFFMKWICMSGAPKFDAGANFDKSTATSRPLKIATSGNCELFAMSGGAQPYKQAKLGVIEEGAWPDMLVVDDDPIRDRL